MRYQSLKTCFILAGSLTLVDASQATPFTFGITYDGNFATVDATSDAINQASLMPGDSFNLSVKAAGSDYFEVLDSFWNFLGATFLVSDSGVRTADIRTSLWFDGNIVAEALQPTVSQMFVHMGMQDFQFGAGTIFDELKVDYVFLASTASYTTIQATDDLVFPGIAFSGGFSGAFYQSPHIAYRDATSDTEQPAESVDEPLALGLLTLAISVLGYAQRRRRGVR